MLKQHILLFFSFLFFVANLSAQEVVVNNRLDTNTITIGDTTLLHLRIEQDKAELVKFPTFADDTLYAKLEVLRYLPTDTAQLVNGRISVEQKLVITAWEKGGFTFPAPKFIRMRGASVDTLTAQEFLLAVNAPAIDTAQAFKEIHGPHETPMTFAEFIDTYLVYIIIGFVTLILLSLFVYYVRTKETQPKTILRRAKIPADKAAINALNELNEKQLWQKGEFKPYFSELTDILKHYIEQRYNVTALELTSHEVLVLLRRVPETDSEANQLLETIFEVADLTKFAKHIPESTECEASLRDAFLFVKQTKVKEVVKPDEKVNEAKA